MRTISAWSWCCFSILAAGCDPATDGEATDKDTETVDTASGGGDDDTWRSSGTGAAYFADGSQDNSQFVLELARATPPRDGFAYFGFVSADGGELIPLGEITVNGEDVLFSGDVGTNAIVAGISHFEAWHSEGDGSTPDGEPAWAGDLNPTVFDVIQALLISNPATPGGDGSLRALETRVEFVRDECLAAVGAGLSSNEVATVGEKVANAIEDPPDDWDDDRTDEFFDESLAIEGNDDDDGAGLVELIFADFGDVVAAIDADDPIRINIEEAYDGVAFTDFWAIRAASNAQSVAATGSTGESKLSDAAEQLDWTLLGHDVNGDGLIDEATEVGLDWAIDRISQMAQMDVAAVQGE